jgi:pyruvate dehydrogenase E2 component (dihydrolipoamide acetyltransferase)
MFLRAKKVGDKIKEGDKLAMVETDKAVIDFDAVEEGFLAQILVPDGTKDIDVNSPIAVLVSKAADVAAFKDYRLGDGVGEEEGQFVIIIWLWIVMFFF